MSQINKVHNHLLSGETITQAAASALYGIARLASRINDIRNLGIDVKRRMIKAKNRYNEIVSVAEYYL